MSIRSIERAIAILNCFGPESPELSFIEISERVGLAHSTTNRIIATLERNGCLARNEDNRKYYLGPKIAQLGALCYSHMDFRKIAHPYMVELRNRFNETISLYVVQGEYRVCIERVETMQALRRVINIGDRLTLTRGAPGRLLLAYLPPASRRTILSRDPWIPEESLDEVRRKGYAVSAGERESGVSSIAVPISNARGKVVAALNMSGPSLRFTASGMPEKIAAMVEYAKTISEALGSVS
jgi:IclR family transcriptional regulator, KDG regulon repressor